MRIGGIYHAIDTNQYFIILSQEQFNVYFYTFESPTEFISNQKINEMISENRELGFCNLDDIMETTMRMIDLIEDGYLGQLDPQNTDYLRKCLREKLKN